MQFLGQNLRHGQGMGHEGRAVLPKLAVVGGLGEVEGGADLIKIGTRVVGPDGILQMLILHLQRHSSSPPRYGMSRIPWSRRK